MPEVLPDHWAAIARNEFQGVDGLNDRGEHKLTRCFRRFKNEHVGETKTPEKWQGRWRNWLDGDFDPVDRPTPAAGANGQASGSAGGGNRHDPPMTRRGKGKLEEFTSAGLDLCKQFMRDAGEGKEFAGYEDRLLGRQLVQIFQGEGQILGVKWGPGWTADEVFARLPDFDAHTKENSQKPAEAGIERQL